MKKRGITMNAIARTDRRNPVSRAQLLQRVRAEFEEMPGLRLTCGQAQRLFGMRPDICERVLAALVAEGTLESAPDAQYALPADRDWHGLTDGASAHERTGARAS